MKYEIFYDTQPHKFLKRQNKQLSVRLLEKLETLRNIPVPSDAKSIIGEHGVFRIRIGDYRIGLKIENEIVYFVVFEHRKDIYKEFP